MYVYVVRECSQGSTFRAAVICVCVCVCLCVCVICYAYQLKLYKTKWKQNHKPHPTTPGSITYIFLCLTTWDNNLILPAKYKYYTLSAIYKFLHIVCNFYTLFAIHKFLHIVWHCLQFTNFYTLSHIVWNIQILHFVWNIQIFTLCLQCTTLPACSLTCRSINELQEKIQGCNHNAEVLYYMSIPWYKQNFRVLIIASTLNFGVFVSWINW